ncbi:hypothetical protein MMC32_007589 [Xylographa parallela]|nr:hypothetical protein [Xylographa parallela]
MDEPTETTIPLYNLTPTPSASQTPSTEGSSSTATSTVSSLASLATLAFPQPTSTSIASPTNALNGSGPAPDLNTFADKTTSAVMAGAVIGGCLLGGLAISFSWWLWKRALPERKIVIPTIRKRVIDARRLKVVWSSATNQMQTSSTQTDLWDEVRDSFSDPENPFRDSLAPSTVSESLIGDDTTSDGGYRETAEVRTERLDRLFRRTHSPAPLEHSPAPLERYGFNGHSFGAIRNSYPMDWLSSPRSSAMVPLPPILKRTSIPAPLSTGRDLPNSPRSAQVKPSTEDFSLGRPLNSPLRGLLQSPLQSPRKQSGTVSGQGTRADLPSTIGSGTRKEVRFGGEQIREFGRTPYASTVNSAVEEAQDRILPV